MPQDGKTSDAIVKCCSTMPILKALAPTVSVLNVQGIKISWTCDVRAVVWFIKAIEPHPFLLRFIVKMWWQNAEVVKKWVWQLNERWLKVNHNNRKKVENWDNLR